MSTLPASHQSFPHPPAPTYTYLAYISLIFPHIPSQPASHLSPHKYLQRLHLINPHIYLHSQHLIYPSIYLRSLHLINPTYAYAAYISFIPPNIPTQPASPLHIPTHPACHLPPPPTYTYISFISPNIPTSHLSPHINLHSLRRLIHSPPPRHKPTQPAASHSFPPPPT